MVYAGLLRRVCAGVINYCAPVIWLFFGFEGSRTWEIFGLAATAIIAVSQLVLIGVTGNSLGGWIAGWVPVHDDGCRVSPWLFFRREWGFWTGFGATLLALGFITLPVRFFLKWAFGDIPFLTTGFEIRNGWRFDSLIGDLIATGVIAWVIRDIVGHPRHQAFHDRWSRTLVVRTRFAKLNGAGP